MKAAIDSGDSRSTSVEMSRTLWSEYSKACNYSGSHAALSPSTRKQKGVYENRGTQK